MNFLPDRFRAVAEFSDGTRRIFDAATDTDAYNAICAYAASHDVDLAFWDGVTDLHYTDGHPVSLRFPDRIIIDATDYTGPVDENGLPLPLINNET